MGLSVCACQTRGVSSMFTPSVFDIAGKLAAHDGDDNHLFRARQRLMISKRPLLKANHANC